MASPQAPARRLRSTRPSDLTRPMIGSTAALLHSCHLTVGRKPRLCVTWISRAAGPMASVAFAHVDAGHVLACQALDLGDLIVERVAVVGKTREPGCRARLDAGLVARPRLALGRCN